MRLRRAQRQPAFDITEVSLEALGAEASRRGLVLVPAGAVRDMKLRADLVDVSAEVALVGRIAGEEFPKAVGEIRELRDRALRSEHEAAALSTLLVEDAVARFQRGED